MAITAAISLNPATIPNGGRSTVTCTITNADAADVYVQTFQPHVANGTGLVFGDPLAGRSPILGAFRVAASGGTLALVYDVTVHDSRARDSTAPTRTIGASIETSDGSRVVASTATLTIDDSP